MKRICVLLILFCSATVLQAQNVNVGLRAGVSGWRHYTDHMKGTAVAASITKEFYIQGTGFGKWAIETALSHDRYRNNRILIVSPYFTNPNSSVVRSVYQTRLKGSYEISAANSSHPVLKRFKNYIGVQLSPTLADIKISEGYANYGGEYEVNYHILKFEFWIGVSNSLQYWVNERWFLSADLSLDANPFKSDNFHVGSAQEIYYFPNGRLTGLLGFGYKF